MLAVCFCGSFCTLKKSLETLERLVNDGYDILPVVSETVFMTSTRFFEASELIGKIEELCGKKVIHSIKDAEPIGPIYRPDAMIITSCTGNTLSKLANGITDSSVTMAAKAHLRNSKPLVIALASNDALSANLENIGRMLNRKNVFFVPFYQDDCIKKPASLIADFSLTEKTLESAVNGKQIQPLLTVKNENILPKNVNKM